MPGPRSQGAAVERFAAPPPPPASPTIWIPAFAGMSGRKRGLASALCSTRPAGPSNLQTGRPASRPLRSAAARRAGQGRAAGSPAQQIALTRPSTAAHHGGRLIQLRRINHMKRLPLAFLSLAPVTMALNLPPPPRQFDYACKMTVTKRMNGAITSERPSKPVLLHVQLDKGVWCRDRCLQTYRVQSESQYGAITLAHVDTSVMNTDISIMLSATGYSETYLSDLPGRSGSTEYDGDCKVGKLTTLK